MAFIQCGFSSEILGMKTNMNVLLPQDTARQSKQAPPVLYLLHGHTDDHAAWTRFTGLERFVRELNLAVVMPTVHNGFYTNTEIGYRYFDFCTQELPALVGSMFHVSTAREDTFVAGCPWAATAHGGSRSVVRSSIAMRRVCRACSILRASVSSGWATRRCRATLCAILSMRLGRRGSARQRVRFALSCRPGKRIWRAETDSAPILRDGGFSLRVEPARETAC